MEVREDLDTLLKELRKKRLNIMHQGLKTLPKDYIDLKAKVDALQEQKLKEQQSALQQASIFETEAKTEATVEAAKKEPGK